MNLDPNHPLAILLQPAIMAKLTFVPIVIQWLKPIASKFLGASTGPASGIAACAAAVGLAVWGGIESKLDPWAIASQAAIAFAYVEAVVYRGLVKPVAQSSSPVIPPNPLVLALVGLLMFPAVSMATDSAQPRVFGVAAGVNGAWYDEGPISDDVEAAVDAKASLSPHISLVGTACYGFRHTYFRYAVGARVTVTDVANRNLSAALGFSYRGSDGLLEPDEWAPNATIGYRPWADIPAVLLFAHGYYGLDSNTAGAVLGARYVLPF